MYFLNPKFQASDHLLWLYSPVCVGPGQKPKFHEKAHVVIIVAFAILKCDALGTHLMYVLCTQNKIYQLRSNINDPSTLNC